MSAVLPARSEYVEWDVGNWSRVLTFWSRAGQRTDGARVLELGSRGGGLSLWLAVNGAEKVICSDLHGPEARAAALHRRWLVDGRIEYRSVDATDIPWEGEFDLVVFKSVLGGVGGMGGPVAQQAMFDSIHRALRPGGQVWFAENMRASPLHVTARRRFVEWEGRWLYPSRSELLGMLASFTKVQSRSLGLAGAFGRSERQRRLLAGLDKSGLERFAPATWRYVMAGVANR